MFDPFKVRKTNRRLQRTASVMHPKGFFETANNVDDTKKNTRMGTNFNGQSDI